MRNEFLRKAVHIMVGIFLLLLLRSGFLNYTVLILMLILSLCIYIFTKNQIPFVSRLIEIVDRGERIHGKGAVTYILGVILVYVFFNDNLQILGASIIILAFGDGFAGIIGKYFGESKLPFNKRKSYEGLLAGILFSFFGALFFVPPMPAFVVSVVISIIESLPIRLGKIEFDDNLFIPILSAIILWALM